jgi:hypothetical protein
LLLAALTFPFSPKTTRRTLGTHVSEDSADVGADPSGWHSYQIEWSATGTVFRVDDALLISSSVTPAPPLAFLAWVDNQYASFDPRGRLRWGIEANRDTGWLEIADLAIKT